MSWDENPLGLFQIEIRFETPFCLFKENDLLKKALACAVIFCSATGSVLLNSAQGAILNFPIRVERELSKRRNCG
ncbi:MAG: hypothetical protein ACLQBD_02400 [Syntrophobacteraceae bacterium]